MFVQEKCDFLSLRFANIKRWKEKRQWYAWHHSSVQTKEFENKAKNENKFNSIFDKFFCSTLPLFLPDFKKAFLLKFELWGAKKNFISRLRLKTSTKNRCRQFLLSTILNKLEVIQNWIFFWWKTLNRYLFNHSCLSIVLGFDEYNSCSPIVKTA